MQQIAEVGTEWRNNASIFDEGPDRGVLAGEGLDALWDLVILTRDGSGTVLRCRRPRCALGILLF
jgi:hypothetical protein